MSEEWRKVRDAPNYEVSRDGQVRRANSGRPLRVRPGNRVVLMSYGERLEIRISDLVTDAFGSRRASPELEDWRIVNRARAYEINSLGNVRNRRTGRPLKPYPNNINGRPQVTLMDNGYRVTFMVHRLVEEAFGR